MPRPSWLYDMSVRSLDFSCDYFRYKKFLPLDLHTIAIAVGVQFDSQVVPNGRVVPSTPST